MRTKDGRELSNNLNIVFIDLMKVKGLEHNLAGASLIEKWAMFLKNAAPGQERADAAVEKT